MLKGFAKFVFAVTLIIVSVSLIIEMKYDLTLNRYLAYSAPLTQEEELFLKEKKTLTFGADFDRNPYLFYNEEIGKTDGILSEYIKFLERNMGVTINIVDCDPKSIEDKIGKENLDFTDTFYDEKDNRNLNFTQSVYDTEGTMVVNYESTIHEYRDLNQKTLAIINGENTLGKIENVLPKGDNIIIKKVDNAKEGLKLLKHGKVDALAGNKLIIDKASRELEMKNQLRHIGKQLYKGEVVFALNPYEAKLYNILNKEILTLKRSRFYGETQEEWLGATSLLGTGSASVRWAQWIITFCVGVVILLMIWETVLNRRIDQKTREIKIEKKNLQTVIDNISSLVAVINRQGEIVTCNEYGKNMLKDENGSFIGCNYGTVKMLKDMYQLHKDYPEKPFYLYEDKYYQVSLNEIGHKETNFILIITDCTEQTIAEQKMRQESKMIAVGQLSAGLAHEIRNPLGLIKTYSYLLQDYSTDEMSEHSLEVINNSVSRIDNLIENLLSFSRLSTDKAEKFNITKLTQNIIDLGKKTFEREHVEIIFKPSKNLFVTVVEESVKIVIYNLINNAIEAFKENNQSDGQIQIEEKIQENLLTITVSDNGPGMTEETIENIFNPFFTTKDTGTGLGLYIVITELKKINGQIRVKSSVNQGSTFIVEIQLEE